MSAEKLLELKDQWRKAKIKAGDFRGLGASRFRYAESDWQAAEIMFNSVYSDGTRNELEIEIEETADYCWTWKDLLKSVLESTESILTINFSVNVWNKQRTDADRKNLFSFTFNK